MQVFARAKTCCRSRRVNLRSLRCASPSFYASLFYQLKKEGNQNSWEIVNGYFYALDKTQQKALLENSSFMLRLEKSNIFTKQQLVKFQKEALEFINDDLTQTR